MALLGQKTQNSLRWLTSQVLGSSGLFIRTPLSPRVGGKLKEPVHIVRYMEKEEEHEEEEEEHILPVPPVTYSTKSVFSSNSYVSTRLFPSTLANYGSRRHYSTLVSSKKKVAVVLSGCGVYDGSEIHEAVSVLIHLSRAGVEAMCYAPDIQQADVIDHLKGKPQEDTRNVLVESARIARGQVAPLAQLRSAEYSAVVFPGGYGAAKNLSTFATKGESYTVHPEVERVINEFRASKKPIGLCCISPVIAAKVIPNLRTTLGNEDKDATRALTKIGAKVEPVGVTEVVVDEQNNVVSTPAYMCSAPLDKIYEGIGKLVETVVSRSKS